MINIKIESRREGHPEYSTQPPPSLRLHHNGKAPTSCRAGLLQPVVYQAGFCSLTITLSCLN